MATRYLLDTNICIYIAKQSPPGVHERRKAPANTMAGYAPTYKKPGNR